MMLSIMQHEENLFHINQSHNVYFSKGGVYSRRGPVTPVTSPEVKGGDQQTESL